MYFSLTLRFFAFFFFFPLRLSRTRIGSVHFHSMSCNFPLFKLQEGGNRLASPPPSFSGAEHAAYCTSTRCPWPDDADCTWLQSTGGLPPIALKGRRRGPPGPPTSPAASRRVQCAANSPFFPVVRGGREQERPFGLSSLVRFPPHSTSFYPGRLLPSPRFPLRLASHHLRVAFGPLCIPLPRYLQHSTCLQRKKRLKNGAEKKMESTLQT